MKMMLQLVQSDELIQTVKYYLLNGWLGPAMPRHPQQARGGVDHCLSNIQLVITYQKVNLYHTKFLCEGSFIYFRTYIGLLQSVL